MADNINQYQGNAALGQGTMGPGIGPITNFVGREVDDAIDKVMQYQVMQNRDQWARNNILVDQQAKQAATDMTFTIGDWLEGDRDVIMGKISKMNEMYGKYRNRTRLLPDGSNAKEVAEWQQIANDIEGDIKRANSRKAQHNGLLGQINTITNTDKRIEAEKWRAKYEKTGINEDILLYPDIMPYNPPPTPSLKFETDVTYSKDKNEATQYVWTAPDIAQGVAAYQLAMNDPQNSDTRKFFEDGTKQVNEWFQALKTANPNDTPEELEKKMRATTQGLSYLSLIDKANADIEFNNQPETLKATTGSVLSKINVFDGIDINDYMKMIASGRGATTSREVKTTYPKLGLEAEQLAQGRARISLGWAELNQRKLEFKAGQDEDIDPTIKNSAIATLMTSPFQPGAKYIDPKTAQTLIPGLQPGEAGQIVELPVNTALQNMFGVPIQETTLTTVDQDAGKSIGVKATQLDITGIYAQRVGSDPNDTRIYVKQKNPVDGKEEIKVYDRAGLNLPANNVLGTTHSEKVAKADAKFKTAISNNNPRIQEMFNRVGDIDFGKKEQGKLGKGIGTVADPLDPPIDQNGNIITSQLQVGKYYLVNGKPMLWKGTQ